MKKKVKDVKKQETTVENPEKPTTTKEKTDSKVLTFEDLNQLIQQRPFVKSKNSKLGEIVIEVDGVNLLYVAQRKYGLAFQSLNKNKWVTQRITSKEQLQNKFDLIEKFHELNKEIIHTKKELSG